MLPWGDYISLRNEPILAPVPQGYETLGNEIPCLEVNVLLHMQDLIHEYLCKKNYFP